MQTSLAMYRLLGYRDFFPTYAPTSKEFNASRVGTDKLGKFCALFLNYARKRRIEPVEQLIAEWFTFNEVHSYKDSPAYLAIITEYKRIKNFHPGLDAIISIESLLNLFLWLQIHHELPAFVQEDASVTINLFDLNLLFNDDVLANYEKAVRIIRPLKDERHLQRLTLAMSFPQSDFLNIDYAQLLYTQFYKALRLLDFMESSPKYQPLFNQLLLYYNCSKKDDYIRGIGLAAVLGTMGKQGWNVLTVEKNDTYEKACNFLDKIAVTPDYNAADEQDDYLSLRSRPIEKIGDGEYRVIFDLFLIKKMYNGLLFTLSDLVRKSPALIAGQFFGNIRMDFSEEVLLYEVMQQIYGQTSVVQYTGNQLKDAGIDREPDYYIRDGNNILLFECKDFFMPGAIKLSYDFCQIEAELKKDGRLGKAVKQLARNIERVKNMELPDTEYISDAVIIYPIIVTHDSLYNCAGLNYWVHFWLKDALAGKYAGIAQPLIIIDIDTLILYQQQLGKKQLNLLEMIKEFIATVDYDQKYVEDATKHAYQSCIPFAEFVTETAIDRHIELDNEPLRTLLDKFNIS